MASAAAVSASLAARPAGRVARRPLTAAKTSGGPGIRLPEVVKAGVGVAVRNAEPPRSAVRPLEAAARHAVCATSTGPVDVTIVLGSRSDLPVAEKALKILDQFNISHQLRVASAHRAPKYLEDIVTTAEAGGCKVFIGMAGVAAALPGVLASMTCKPVIGVPCGGKVPYDSLLSIVQMPPGMPVATVGTDRGDNAAILAVQILAAFNPQLAATFAQYRTDMTNNVIKDDEKTVSEYSR